MMSMGRFFAAAVSVIALASASQATELRVLTYASSDVGLKITQDAADRFMATHPGVTVTIDTATIGGSWADYAVKVLSQFNSGTNYDVYRTAIETFATLASRDIFVPLEDYVAKDPSYSADVDPRLFELASYKGHNYFAPSEWNNIVTYYNRTMFDAAGVAYPTNGWTWDEFRAAAEKLTIRDANGNVTQFGYEVPNFFFALQPWFITNGTSVLNADWTASNMLDPKVSESLQYLYDLINVSKVSPIPGQESMDNQFVAAQVAMISRGHWVVGNIAASGLDVDVAPVASKENDHTVIGFGGYAISKTTPDKQLAWELVAYLTDQEALTAEGDSGGGVPARISATQTEKFKSFPPNSALFNATLPTTQAVPSPANFVEVQNIFMRYFNEMMSGQISIADGVKAADEEINASFAKLKAAQ